MPPQANTDKEPAPAPETDDKDLHLLESSMRTNDRFDDIEESYTQRLESTDKASRKRGVGGDFSDSRNFELESQEGGV